MAADVSEAQSASVLASETDLGRCGKPAQSPDDGSPPPPGGSGGGGDAGDCRGEEERSPQESAAASSLGPAHDEEQPATAAMVNDVSVQLSEPFGEAAAASRVVESSPSPPPPMEPSSPDRTARPVSPQTSAKDVQNESPCQAHMGAEPPPLLARASASAEKLSAVIPTAGMAGILDTPPPPPTATSIIAASASAPRSGHSRSAAAAAAAAAAVERAESSRSQGDSTDRTAREAIHSVGAVAAPRSASEAAEEASAAASTATPVERNAVRRLNDIEGALTGIKVKLLPCLTIALTSTKFACLLNVAGLRRRYIEDGLEISFSGCMRSSVAFVKRNAMLRQLLEQIPRFVNLSVPLSARKSEV